MVKICPRAHTCIVETEFESRIGHHVTGSSGAYIVHDGMENPSCPSCRRMYRGNPMSIPGVDTILQFCAFIIHDGMETLVSVA